MHVAPKSSDYLAPRDRVSLPEKMGALPSEEARRPCPSKVGDHPDEMSARSSEERRLLDPVAARRPFHRVEARGAGLRRAPSYDSG